MTKPEYQKWIDGYVTKWKGHVRGHCTAAASEMVAAFPELRKTVGFVLPNEAARAELPTVEMSLEERRCVYHPTIGLAQHAWCVTPEGEIVDPTVSQFKSVVLIYVEYEEAGHGPMPAGRCPNCGEITFPEQRGICDDRCREQFNKYMEE